MSKYRLIKEYPNSPELGFITDETMHFPAHYPEFWEKVKEWRIVEFSSMVDVPSQINWEEFKEFLKIKSVKRLSDNTIFSIGDKVINPKLKSNATFTIERFELDCVGEHMLALGGGGAIGIHKIEKYKEPILTTEDGVNLFQGDDFWHVDTYFCSGKGILNNSFKPLNGYKHFSTEQAAKDWIEMNKPQFSKNDLIKAVQAVGNINVNQVIYELKK